MPLSAECRRALIPQAYDMDKNIIEWTRGMWADCGNVNSPVSFGLFEGENKSKL